jgi:hypothetical protein
MKSSNDFPVQIFLRLGLYVSLGSFDSALRYSHLAFTMDFF